MKTSIAILCLTYLLLNGSTEKEFQQNDQPSNQTINPLLLIDFKNIRDTVYTLKDHIIEINLTTHQGIVRF